MASMKEKLKKIKNLSTTNPFNLPENEKTGVLNGLLLLGTAVGAFLSMQRTVSGWSQPACVNSDVDNNSPIGGALTPTTVGNPRTQCADTVDDRVTETGNTAHDSGLNLASWQDHTWHDHCWWDHCWHDHSWTNWDKWAKGN